MSMFCPDGVKFMRLGDIGKICMCKRIMKHETSSEGDVPFYKIGTFGKVADAYISRDTFERYKNEYPYPKKGDVLLSAAGTIGRTVIFDGEDAYFQDSNIVWIANDERLILNKFLYYLYQMKPWKTTKGGTVQRLYNDGLAGAVVPVPPLEVQQEIVDILDKFTELISLLEKERELRKKQYQYYLDKLMTFSDGVEYKRFDEACTLHARIGWQRLTKAEHQQVGDYLLITGTDFTDAHEVNYSTCVYVSEERYNQDEKIQLRNGDILITKDGTLGKVAQVRDLPKPATLNSGVFVVRCKDNSLLNRFILYYLLSNHFMDVVERQKTGSTISHLTQALFSRLLIPVSSIERQKQIVDILDRFDTLTNSLSEGLPAEIEARTKQYEYYRDKLLTFKQQGE